MEDVTCLLCGCGDRRVRFRGRDRLHHVPGEFTLVECSQCRFLYLSPRPDGSEIGQYYPSDYLPFRPALHEERSTFRRFERLFGLHRRCQAIRRYKSRGSLLDVGCGTGDFLAVMRSYRGWNVRGLEPHQGAVSQAREKYGLVVDQAYLDDAPYPPNTFDVVTLWDVLEHVPNPVRSLRRLHDLLRPDGLIVLGVPNRESFDARLFGQYWAGLDVPRHFSVFSVGHLTQALLQAGFGKPHLFNLSGGYHTFALSTRFWLDGRTSTPQARSILLASSHSPITRLMAFPYFSMLKWLRKGSTMVVLARSEREYSGNRSIDDDLAERSKQTLP